MKTISIETLYYLANHTSKENFKKYVQHELTGEPIENEIDCNPVVVDKNELNKINNAQL